MARQLHPARSARRKRSRSAPPFVVRPASSTWSRDDPRPEGRGSDQHPESSPRRRWPMMFARCCAQRDRQCREQPQPRCRCISRRRSERRQGGSDEAFRDPCARPLQPDRQTVQSPPCRRSRAGRSWGYMGQKSSPIGLRLQINRTWDSRWFAEGQDYGRLLLEDLQIREYHPEEGAAGGDFQGGDRASGQDLPDLGLCRSSRRDHRQEGRRHREAASASFRR